MNPTALLPRSIARAAVWLVAFAAPALAAPPLAAPPLAPSPVSPGQPAPVASVTPARPPGPSTAPTGKPWVDDFAAFVNASTGGRRWVVGRSAVACLSEHEASESAARDAARQLLTRVYAHRPAPVGPESEAWFRQRLTREVVSGRLVKDRWVARTPKPYGELWTEAVLVEASAGHLTPIVRDHDTWLRSRHVAPRNTFASIAGLSVAILVIYAVVNVITKGYFRGRLRAAAALALVLVCGLFFLG